MRNKRIGGQVAPEKATPRRAREYVKDLGWKLIQKAGGKDTPDLEAIGLNLVMFMHFERSLEGYDRPAKARKGDIHPSFEEYAAAYLAQPTRQYETTPEALALLRDKYPPKASPWLPNGYSYWQREEREPYE